MDTVAFSLDFQPYLRPTSHKAICGAV